MNIQRRISLLGIALLCATASFAQQVKTDYDRSADFRQYKTYCWGNVHTQDALLVDRVKAAVNSALAAKGWTQVESGGDVSIMAMEMNQSHRTLNTYYDNFGGGWRRAGGLNWSVRIERLLRGRVFLRPRRRIICHPMAARGRRCLLSA